MVVVLLGLLGGGGAGCGSIFRQTTVAYPSAPCSRLELRMDETRRAGQRVHEAVAILRDHAARNPSTERVATDVDRLEVAAFELSRCSAAARDAAADCEQAASWASELEMYRQQARRLLDATAHLRRVGPPPTVAQVDALFAGDATGVRVSP